jgi:hypothetical protein
MKNNMCFGVFHYFSTIFISGWRLIIRKKLYSLLRSTKTLLNYKLTEIHKPRCTYSVRDIESESHKIGTDE